MSRLSLNDVRCEALFASPLQRSDDPCDAQVRDEIMQTIRSLGSMGCALRVAQEFGDHPETAVRRMQWAKDLVAASFPAEGAVPQLQGSTREATTGQRTAPTAMAPIGQWAMAVANESLTATHCR